jgi:hypothetical protein
MSFQSLRSLRRTVPGGVAAANFAKAHRADLPEGCEITPLVTTISATGSFHCSDAAPSSEARAVAAARRTTSQASATVDEPPVALMPSSRATLPIIHSPSFTLVGFSGASRLQRVKWQAANLHGHVAINGVGSGLLDAHAGQRHVQLFGGQHGQRGVHALAHFAARHGKDDAAIRGDLDPAIEGDVALGLEHVAPCPRRERCGITLQPTTSAPAAPSAGQQQGTPLHACTPAARLMAARTRW